MSNRVPLGRVDDIFGPVDGPLYLVRFCGEGGLHENVKENDAAFSVAKYSTYLEAGPRVRALMVGHVMNIQFNGICLIGVAYMYAVSQSDFPLVGVHRSCHAIVSSQ